jgi:hypothetical protein
MFQFGLWNRRQNAIEEIKHLPVGVGAATEQDDSRPLGSLERQQSRVVEVGRHDNMSVPSSGFKNFGIGNRREPDRARVNGLMPAPPEMGHSLRRHRHVHQEPHPLNSITSSSARLAA